MQREDRLADVHRRLSDAEQRYAGATADLVRESLQRFRSRLRQVEQRGAAVDDRRWADYASVLDRGLDELDLEVSRAETESADPGQGVAEVLAVHTSALELAGWRMQYSVHDESADTTEARTRIALAESELERYRAARGASAPIPADAIEQSMEQVRQAARQVGRG